jgi:hypothetical protein
MSYLEQTILREKVFYVCRYSESIFHCGFKTEVEIFQLCCNEVYLTKCICLMMVYSQMYFRMSIMTKISYLRTYAHTVPRR